MSCAEWQEKIALFTGADLPANEASAVESHLATCDDCQAFERELTETRAMLLSTRTVDDADVATVRSNVLRELQRRRRPPAFAWLPYAAAVALLLFGWAMWRTPVVETPIAEGVGPVREPGRAVAEAPKPSRVAKRKARVRPRPKPEPTIVTLFTDDPDVVIVWIAD